MEASIIIVGHNESHFIEKCLSSIFETLEGLLVEVLYFDNGSRDDTLKMLESKFPLVRRVISKTNVGLTNARNQAAQLSIGEYILFLDADTEIKSNALIRILEFIQKNPCVGIVGPKLLNSDGGLQYSCRTFPSWRTFVSRGLGLDGKSATVRNHLMTDFDHSVVREVDWVLGAAMMIRRDVFQKIGGIDSHFPMYYNDVDLCWRVKKAGLKVVYYPEAKVIHHYQRLSAKGGLINPLKWSHLKSALRFFWKKYIYS
jgi:GT2 family glycosyltransferase